MTLSFPYMVRKKNLIIFVDMEVNQHFLYRYGTKEVFSIECWNKKKKSNSFLTNYTNRHLVDSVMRKEENRPMIVKMYRSICIDNGKEWKSFGFWLHFPSFPTRYIGKILFFFQSFFDNWIKQFNTFDRQQAVETNTPWPFPCKSERTLFVFL